MESADRWLELAREIERAARPHTSAAKAQAPTDDQRLALVLSIAKGLEIIAIGLRQGWHSDANHFSREQLHKRMQLVHKHASALLACFNGQMLPPAEGSANERIEKETWALAGNTMGYVDKGDEQPADYWDTLLPALRDLVRRSDKASTLARYGGGRGKPAAQPEGLSTRQLCALGIYEAWRLFNPAQPAGSDKTSPSVLLTKKYWSICGFDPVGQGGVTESVWMEALGSVGLPRAGESETLFLTMSRNLVRKQLTP
jgi:hypothetical protein